MAPDAPPRVELRRVLDSASSAATEALGAALGQRLVPGSVVALEGELGSGKTCFARGVARGLGAEQGVASPSFTLMHEYAGRLPVYHLDAWMQRRGEAFLQDGGAEWLRADGVSIVEWAERVEAWLPLPRISMRMEHRGREQRRLDIRVLALSGDAAGADLLASLRRAVADLPLAPHLSEVRPSAAGMG